MSQTILVADDSATMRLVVEMAFKGSQFRIVTAESGEQALQAAYEHRPHVVLLDYHFPDRNGLEICRAFKSDPNLRDTPILMLGGTYYPFNEEQALQSGCSAVLIKPFKTEALTSTVAELALNAPAPSPISARPQPLGRPPEPGKPRFGLGDRAALGAQGLGGQTLGTQNLAPQNMPKTTNHRFQRQAPGPPESPSAGNMRRQAPSGSTPNISRMSNPPAPASRPLSREPGPVTPTAPAPQVIDPEMLDRLVREEVQRAVREQMLSMVRSVLNDLFKEKILPRLLKYGEDRIESFISTDLQRMMQQRVDEELARLTGE